MRSRVVDAADSSTPSEHVVVRALGDPHRRFAADLHCAVLPSGLFPRLGSRFMMSYHAAFEQSPYAVALVASVDEEPVGLLMGTVDDQAHHRWIVRHRGGRMAFSGAVALLCRPRLAVLFIRTRARRYLTRLLGLRRVGSKGGPTPTTGRVAGGAVGDLTHVAVSPDLHGSGIGSALVDAYVHAAEVAGTQLLRVITSREGPEAVGFYERLGWEATGETVDFDDKPYVRLVLRLPR